jgi:hypothetical protein
MSIQASGLTMTNEQQAWRMLAAAANPAGGFVFAGEEFVADFLIVMIRWFELLTSLSESNCRVYKLLSDERCLSVMAIMRIDAVEVTQFGQVRRTESLRIATSEQL